MGSPINPYQVAKPRVSADGERVFFISDRGGRWQVWGAELRTGKAVHVGRGCEPTLSPDGELLLWVTNGWWGGKTSLITRSLATGRTIKFARPSSAGEFEYYPSFVDGGRKILFSSAPKFAHRHRSSPLSFGKPSQGSYGVWLLDLERDVAVRLPLQNTADRSNDIFPINSRWAKFVS